MVSKFKYVWATRTQGREKQLILLKQSDQKKEKENNLLNPPKAAKIPQKKPHRHTG